MPVLLEMTFFESRVCCVLMHRKWEDVCCSIDVPRRRTRSSAAMLKCGFVFWHSVWVLTACQSTLCSVGSFQPRVCVREIQNNLKLDEAQERSVIICCGSRWSFSTSAYWKHRFYDESDDNLTDSLECYFGNQSWLAPSAVRLNSCPGLENRFLFIVTVT